MKYWVLGILLGGLAVSGVLTGVFRLYTADCTRYLARLANRLWMTLVWLAVVPLAFGPFHVSTFVKTVATGLPLAGIIALRRMADFRATLKVDTLRYDADPYMVDSSLHMYTRIAIALFDYGYFIWIDRFVRRYAWALEGWALADVLATAVLVVHVLKLERELGRPIYEEIDGPRPA